MTPMAMGLLMDAWPQVTVTVWSATIAYSSRTRRWIDSAHRDRLYAPIDGQVHVTRQASARTQATAGCGWRFHRALPKIAPAVTRWWPSTSSTWAASNRRLPYW